jgi:hypothetical protein
MGTNYIIDYSMFSFFQVSQVFFLIYQFITALFAYILYLHSKTWIKFILCIITNKSNTKKNNIGRESQLFFP